MFTNILAIIVVALAVSVHVYAEEKQQQPPRWQHVQNSDGKILATVDTKDGSVDCKEDCKDVIPVLLQQINGTVAQCNQVIQQLQNPKKEVKKGKK